MAQPPDMAGFSTLECPAWKIRCDACGRLSPLLADDPDPFLDAEAWARLHVLDCPGDPS